MRPQVVKTIEGVILGIALALSIILIAYGSAIGSLMIVIPSIAVEIVSMIMLFKRAYSLAKAKRKEEKAEKKDLP